MKKSADIEAKTIANTIRHAHPERSDDEIIASLAKQLAAVTGDVGVPAGDLAIDHKLLIDLGNQLRSEAARTLGRSTDTRRNAIYNILSTIAEHIGHGLLGGNEAENLHLYYLLIEIVVSLRVAREGLSFPPFSSGKGRGYNTDPIGHMADAAVENLLHLVQRRKVRQHDPGAKAVTAASIDLELGHLLDPGLSNDQAVAWIRKIKRRLREYRKDYKQLELSVRVPGEPSDDDLDTAIDQMVTMIKAHPPR